MWILFNLHFLSRNKIENAAMRIPDNRPVIEFLQRCIEEAKITIDPFELIH